MSYFFNQLQQIKHEGKFLENKTYTLHNHLILRFGCFLSDLSFISEKIEELRSIFTFKCSICNITERIKTENPDDGIPQGTINISAVAGSVATGIKYCQLSELLAALDIPCMTNKTYSKSHEILCEAVDKENECLMRNAANEEARLAKECGKVTESAVPIISVIVDGAWSAQEKSRRMMLRKAKKTKLISNVKNLSIPSYLEDYPKMRFATADDDYGMVDENIEPDLPKDEYDSRVSQFLKKLENIDRKKIEEGTYVNTIKK
ncbi:hypothetical protein RN001_003477 [Aquatica leii]|uniref:Mutator-like transposase domain-containing protein n=1 Tax=Aquatica leii TaxID=1421715 RepID=A0AAN7SE06_9COLE|nr:hypothetical protein RN001_003477 [Aquatica leii]